MRDMRTFGLTTLAMLLAGCTAATSDPEAAPAPIPAGAAVGASGYATLLIAPPPPRPSAGPASISDERGRNPDAAAMRDAQALDRRLKAAEAGDYIGYRVVRGPTPRFAFQFRRDAARTLAGHSRNAHTGSTESAWAPIRPSPVPRIDRRVAACRMSELPDYDPISLAPLMRTALNVIAACNARERSRRGAEIVG